MRSSSGPEPRTCGTERGRLSCRELDMAALISEGFSNTEISIALKIGEPTVKKHVG
jgi:ATP/maltotriose-dependent transcriptional regulator MalT